MGRFFLFCLKLFGNKQAMGAYIEPNHKERGFQPMRNIKTKGVAFNMNCPDQKQLFEYATTRPNFSNYMKRLIQRDMESKKDAPK